MDSYFTGQRPFNPYLNQAYTAPYIGTITHVKGAEGWQIVVYFFLMKIIQSYGLFKPTARVIRKI